MNTPQTIDRLWGRGELCPYDEILDVRSPSEFAEDHMPNAINLPVLSDNERSEVGTIYQRSPFEARRRGAALVAKNIGQRLDTFFAGKPKDYRPFIYCFRGGHRSGSLAIVLAQIGWRVTTLRGGYKHYRAYVREQLAVVPTLFEYRVLAGPTGSAKTRILQRLAVYGGQVLDLEALAGHRGSILGERTPQPPQKLFESHLLAAYDRWDPSRPVWVEAESHRVGDILLPSILMTAMKAADVWEVQMPLKRRVEYLLAEYDYLTRDPISLKAKLRRLESRIGTMQLEEWDRHIDRGDWAELIESLLRKHYDPSYAHAARNTFRAPLHTLTLTSPSDEAIDELMRPLSVIWR